FAEISTAWALLSHPERRRAYDASLGGHREALDADRIANAETNYRKGEILVRQGNFRGAIDYLRAAVELWPEEPEYQSALGWALFKKTPSEPKAAREHLERAVALGAQDATAQTRLATVLRELPELDGSADRPRAGGLRARLVLDHLHVEPDREQVAHVEGVHDGAADVEVLVLLDLDARVALLPLPGLFEQRVDLG